MDNIFIKYLSLLLFQMCFITVNCFGQSISNISEPVSCIYKADNNSILLGTETGKILFFDITSKTVSKSIKLDYSEAINQVTKLGKNSLIISTTSSKILFYDLIADKVESEIQFKYTPNHKNYFALTGSGIFLNGFITFNEGRIINKLGPLVYGKKVNDEYNFLPDDLSKNLQSIFPQNSPEITSLEISPNKKLLSACLANGEIFLINTDKGSLKQKLFYDNSSINSMCFSGDSKLIIASLSNHEIFIYNIEQSILAYKIYNVTEKISKLCTSNDNKYIFGGGESGRVFCWSLADGSLQSTSYNHTTDIAGLCYLDDATVLSASSDGKISISGLNNFAVNTSEIKENNLKNNERDNSENIQKQNNSTEKILSEDKEPENLDKIDKKSSVVVKNKESAEEIKLDSDEETVLSIKTTRTVNKDAIAVVIGNQNYTKKDVAKVDFAIEDAALIKEYLMKTLGYKEANIIYATDATQSDFNSFFGKENNYKGQLYNLVKPNKSDVFIYYSGHGAPDPESKIGYFVPVDCNPSTLALNGYSLNTFYTNLSQIPAKSFTIVIDACFSGGYEKGTLLKDISPIYITTDESQLPAINGTVFSSSKGDQVSTWYPEKRHSLFTYYYLMGISGDADENKDNKITLSEIKFYLEENVTYMARKLKGRTQNPQIKGDDNIIMVEY